MAKRKRIPCDRGQFGTQAEYEDCLEERRARRNGAAPSRLTSALDEYAGAIEDGEDFDTDE